MQYPYVIREQGKSQRGDDRTVYVICDMESKVRYVGCTSNFRSRMIGHPARRALGGKATTRVLTIFCGEDRLANEIERRFICELTKRKCDLLNSVRYTGNQKYPLSDRKWDLGNQIDERIVAMEKSS